MRAPDHNDADLILKLYDLRREPVMRQARNFWGSFQPRRFEDVKALTDPTHPQNAFFRQVTSYWEMAASFVNREILHPDLFADSCGEGLFVYAKLSPFLKELRESYNPLFLTQLERAASQHPSIREKLGRIRERLQGTGGNLPR